MSFLLQNDLGTVELANSYVSISEYTSYVTDRYGVPTQTDAQIETALINATDFVDNNDFIGVPTNSTDQSTKIPVTYCEYTTSNPCYYFDSTSYTSTNSGVATDIKNATCEYAYYILTNGDLYMNITPANTNISSITKKIGPLTKVTNYAGTSSDSIKVIVPKAENYLKKSGLLLFQGNNLIRS